MRKIFLACPYSHADAEVVEQRFRACNEVAATIVRAGHVVFSQVSMSHPINLCLAELDRAAIGRLWAPVDAFYMDHLEELIVLDPVSYTHLDVYKRQPGRRRWTGGR